MKHHIGYLLLDRIKIQAANAISSPLTYGFPAITGFLGAVHALSRKLQPHLDEITLEMNGVLIACHSYQLQAFRPHDYADYTFIQTRNPLKKKNGKFQAPPIIEEGKINLEVSLLIELQGDESAYEWLNDDVAESKNRLTLQKHVESLIQQQRIAGGSVIGIQSVRYFPWSTKVTTLKSAILPAFVLMEAKEAVAEIAEELEEFQPSPDVIDAMIETATLRHCPEQTQVEDKKTITWHTRSGKQGRGWLVPIPIGFQAIAPIFEAGKLAKCRNPEYSSQYVECVYSLGKWVFPHRLANDLKHCFWRYHYNQDEQLYLVTQQENL